MISNKKKGEYIVDLKTKIERVLSEILSDRYECRVQLRFEKKVTA